jgi:hypothetical protein
MNVPLERCGRGCVDIPNRVGRTAIHLAVTAAARNKEDSLACLRYGTWAALLSTWPSRPPPATERTASPASGTVLERTTIHLAVTAVARNKKDSLACLKYSTWREPPSTWPSRPPPATRRTASPASGTVPGPHRYPPGRHGRRPQQGGQPRLRQVQYLEGTAIHLAVKAAARHKEDSLACLRYGTWAAALSTWPSRPPPATRRTASPASGTVPGVYRHHLGSHGRRPQQRGQPRLPQVRYLERTPIHLDVTAAAHNKEDSLAFLR